MQIITGSGRGLGIEDGSIPDDQITASSTLNDDPDHGPSNARLNRPRMPPTAGGWTAKTEDLNQWIQVDLSGSAGGLKWVTGVVTQGRNGGGARWVTEFTVSYSTDGGTWTKVQNGNGLTRIVRKQ